MDNYQFSNTYRASCVAYSPGSTFIATALKDKVHIRSTSSLESIRTWACSLPDEPSTSCLQDVTIDTLDWSPGGSFLTCKVMLGHRTKTTWLYQKGITESNTLESLRSSRFWHVWNQLESMRQMVGSARLGPLRALIPHLIYAEAEYTVHFYSPVGVHVGSFVPDLITASAHDMAQSIKRTAWSPNGRHFAIGDSGGLVHVVESEGWKSIANLRGYQAVSISEPALRPWSHGQANIVQFERASVTPSASPIHWLGFSPDGTVLFFGQDTVLHVYAFLLNPASSKPDIEPTVTVSFNAPIKSVEYCPTSNRVAVVTRTKFLYLYDGLGVEGVEIPVGACSSDGLNANRMAESFAAMSVHWAPDGNSAAVCDKNDFCLVYEEAAGQGAEVDTWDEL
ncbi:hypothetical protein CspeluHIS016_0502340 [Cutaneotrichosporon spelunceum]|uniref:WD40 repeat-like protein n=1 Tax=Cutaneotrichosporon spelunceum TaxID=1672016 RepID=A0AAD3TWL1_9TREE|nr:hypothetical protein CspeluHIS016_0502340 [Cutaneotrichosporon spelunceum]